MKIRTWSSSLASTGGKINPNTSGSKTRKIKGFDSKKDPRVITTPKKNRFDVLDTESELQNVFRNLQRSDSTQPLALVTIPEDNAQSFSDGSRTCSKSKMGTALIRQTPFSELLIPFIEDGVIAKKSLRKTDHGISKVLLSYNDVHKTFVFCDK